MMGVGASPLWRQIARQTVLGKRGLAKTGTLWLPLAVVLALRPPEALRGAWLAGVGLFAASACRTVGTILANDIADRTGDAAAGKRRWVARLSPAAGAAVVAGLLALGVLVLIWCGANAGALAAYGGAVLLGMLYSLPPVRLKGRGLAGLVAYGLCCALAYGALPALWFRSDWSILALLALVVFCDRWVNLHFHQVLDLEADAVGDCRTYAVRVGPVAARHSLRAASQAAALAIAALSVFCAVALGPLGAGAVGLTALVAVGGAAHASIARRGGTPSPLVRELPASYLGLTYAAFWVLPPLLLTRSALQTPSLWLLAAAAAASSLLTTAKTVAYRYD